MEVFGDDRVLYENNYLHIPIVEDRSKGIEVEGRPMFQGAKCCKERTKL